MKGSGIINKQTNNKNDQFADIASKGLINRDVSLVMPQPPILQELYLPNVKFDKEAVFVPLKKMSSREELYEELDKQKGYYKKFLMNLSPKLKNPRIKVELNSFDWRIQTNEDLRDFQSVLSGKGNWKRISVPHYGGPLGNSVTYYRTILNVSVKQLKLGAIFICFKGVDYKAQVYINGTYLGSHEGFFAPFEFDFTSQAIEGENTLLVVVENDFICLGNDSEKTNGKRYTGDKIYAATGLGYDDSERGWHHCPPGMGIYQDVYVEARSRVNIQDIFVRPLIDKNSAEAWIEIHSCDLEHKDITLELSLYGQNFSEVVFENLIYKPTSNLSVGLGDSLTETKVKAEGRLNAVIPLLIEKGINYLKVCFEINNPKLWELDTPWLYNLQVKLVDEKNQIADSSMRQFGMRSFVIDEESQPKGTFLLNGKPIRLRGANTMGHEQQCVYKKDWDQLLNDLLLAKICNMNFLRLTQRPVQSEIYDYCDRLGLMTQTDLPIFGGLRRNQFFEAVRQVSEMEHLVRSHPCNVVVSYINEPFPNANNMPHRCLTRDEMEEFFKSADIAVKLINPDRVIKKVDGDYDPPVDGLPDNHCYPCWYNGHGIDIGKLNKGYWMYVKPGWHYGCGEFGAEGLDSVEVMKKYYPKEWLPKTAVEEEDWSPNSIIGAQTGYFHYFFYETQYTLLNWVRESHKHQAFATKIMTEAYRRDSRLNTFAIHLFIDAFPSGWMKTIMDVERTPKPAYFAYKEALTPLMVNIRSDRFKFFQGEEVKLEAWICNDKNTVAKNTSLHYQVEMDGKIIFAAKGKARIPTCSSEFQGYITFKAPEIIERKSVDIRLALVDTEGKNIHDTVLAIDIFPKEEKLKSVSTYVLKNNQGKASTLINELGLKALEFSSLTKKSMINNCSSDNNVVIIDDYEEFKRKEKKLLYFVEKGGTLIFLELKPGNYEIYDRVIGVKPCGMLPLHFVSRDTKHLIIDGFKSDDFRLWYDKEVDYITPLLENTFTAEDFTDILISGNVNENGQWGKSLAAAELKIGEGTVCICQVKLAGRTEHNPVADIFARRLVRL